MLQLLDLPNELLRLIGLATATDRDFSAFLRANKSLHKLLENDLYRRNGEGHVFSRDPALDEITPPDLRGPHWSLEKPDPAFDQGTALFKAIFNRGMPEGCFKKALANTDRRTEHGKRMRDSAFFLCVQQGRLPLISLQLRIDEELQLNSPYIRRCCMESVRMVREKNLLLYAIRLRRKPDIISMLLATGQMNVHERNHEGLTPLMMAVTKGQADTVRMLLSHGADPALREGIENSRQGQGSAFVAAVGTGNMKLIKMLLATGRIDTRAIGLWGENVLHVAAGMGSPKLLRMFLKTHKDDINVQNYRGNNALGSAVLSGNVEAVRLLLSVEEVDVNITDYWGSTPLGAAYRWRFHEIAELLSEAGGEARSLEDGLMPWD